MKLLRVSTLFIFTIFFISNCGTDSDTNTSFNCGNEITDIDGNTYPTVRIGEQCWMEENLKTSKYRDGSAIPNVPNSDEWKSLTTGAWIYYENEAAYGNIYGKLYNWFAANDGRGLCPTDWKLPSDEGWKLLEINLGMTEFDANSTDFRGQTENVGGRLKSIGTQFWLAPNEGANNNTGFSALPGGFRRSTGAFEHIKNIGGWLSSTEEDETSVWTRALYATHGGVSRYNNSKRAGFSVRCIKD